MSGHRKLTLLFSFLVLTSMACALLNPTPAAWALTPEPSDTPETLPAAAQPGLAATATPLPGSPPAIITTPTRPVPSTSPTALSPSQGFWLVYASADGKTVTAQKDASGQPVTVSLPEPVLQPGDLKRGLSPDGELLAVRTGGADGSNLALTLIHLVDGTAEPITSLLTPELEETLLSSSGEQPPEAVLAVEEAEALAWSPDGRRLAFIAAADGPSSDLYVYDLGEKKARRLTTGSNQAAAPSWSPDGKWIVHQEVQTFGSGAGWKVTAVWAAAVDHSETRRLYSPASESGGERLLGWSGSDTLMVYTWTPAGSRSARELPLNTRWLYPVYKGPFEGIALDPVSKTVVAVQSQVTAAQAGLAPGLYRFGAYDKPPVPSLVQVGEWRGLVWWREPGVFTAGGLQGALAVRLDGKTVFFPGEGQVMPSPDGTWVIGWGGKEGLRLYQANGTLLQELGSGEVESVAWLPDASGLVYLAGTELYEAAFPQALPVLVDGEVGGFGVR